MRTIFSFLAGLFLVLTFVPEICCAQDAQNVQLMGRWPYGAVWAVAVKGNYVYIGAGGVVCVLDVTNASSPVKVGELVTPDIVKKFIQRR